jgi:hypothetical protein
MIFIGTRQSSHNDLSFVLCHSYDSKPSALYVCSKYKYKEDYGFIFFQKMTFATAISCTLESHGKVTLGHVMLVGCA